MYNSAFSFKNSKYPIDVLVNLTLLNHRISLEKYARAGLLVFDDEQENIVFAKTNTVNSIKVLRDFLNSSSLLDFKSLFCLFSIVFFNRKNANI